MERIKIKDIILDQKEYFMNKQNLIERDIKLEYFLKSQQIILISGIRRCGKSALLYLIKEKLKLNPQEYLYFNFDDERIYNFEVEDFNKLIEIHQEIYGIKDISKIILFFDEIQNVNNWEKFLNRMYEKGIKIFVTGSNAKLLNSEIATTLTGRNLVLNLYPFSFKEFLKFNKFNYDLNNLSTQTKALLKNQFNDFFKLGGFPLVVKEKNMELIKSYYKDILYRDIIARYNLSQVEELKILSSYLITNTSKSFSYSILKEVTKIKSLSTLSKYLEYLENTYLFYYLSKFDYSYKKQLLNHKKSFVSDLSFNSQLGFKFSQDKGRLLENLVFIELKRRDCNIYYHKGKNECDFIIKKKLKIISAIQVTESIENVETKNREIRGLIDAAKTYNLSWGLILTDDQEDELIQDGIKIIIKPIYKWLLE